MDVFCTVTAKDNYIGMALREGGRGREELIAEQTDELLMSSDTQALLQEGVRRHPEADTRPCLRCSVL